MLRGLVEPDGVGMHLRDVQQEVLIAHVNELLLLVVGGQAGHVVGLIAALDARDVALRLFGERRLRQEVGPGAARAVAPRRPDDQPIDVEAFLVEPDAAAQPEAPVGRRGRAAVSRSKRSMSMPMARSSPIDCGLYWPGPSMFSVPPLSSSMPIAVAELVALGVAAEVVVVVEDQNPRARDRRRPGRNARPQGR